MKKRILLIALLLTTCLNAADIQSLIQDTQRLNQEGQTTNMVWWIPVEFWEETLKQNPALTEEQRHEFVNALDQYSAFVTVDMTVGVFGGVTHKSREEVLANIELNVDEEIIEPIPTDELTPDAANFFNMMKPMMSQMMGALGEGMHFIVYPNYKDGVKIIDPTSEGSFEYTSFGISHKWRLPLGSLLPPMLDKETNETFPGNYKFNPFTGSKLETK